MPKAPNRRLKVFQAQFGFFDSVVAASSQAAALKAWDTHQNLFKDGQARLVTDSTAIDAALAHPDTPLRRAVGSKDAFELEPKSLPEVPDAPNRKASGRAGSHPKPQPAPSKPPADRSHLDAAEAALKGLDVARKAEETKLRRRRDELETQIVEAQSAYVTSRKAATATIVEARKAYRAEGGRN